MSVYQRPLVRRLVAVILLVCAGEGFLRADAASHSISDTLLAVAPMWLVCGLAWWFVQRLGAASSPSSSTKNKAE